MADQQHGLAAPVVIVTPAAADERRGRFTEVAEAVARAFAGTGRPVLELRTGAEGTGIAGLEPRPLDCAVPVGPAPLAAGYRVHRQLHPLEPAVVVAPDAGALLWAVLDARHQRSGYLRTTVVVVRLAPGPDEPVDGPAAAQVYERELVASLDRSALCTADIVVPPDADDLGPLAVSLVRTARHADGPPCNGPTEGTDDRPLVSVVVTHYERPALARRAIDSLLAQTWRPLQIVVVDDGSTSDAAGAFLEELEARSLEVEVVVVRQPNAGLGAARNHGVAVAAAPYVAFLDDDDEAEPTYVERLVRAVQATDAAAAVVGFKVHEGVGSGPLAGRPEHLHWLYCSGTVDLAALDNCIGGAAALFHKDDLRSVGGYHTQRGLAYEDWQLLVKLALAGKSVVAVPDALLRYRVAASSMLRTVPIARSHALVLEPYERAMPDPLRSWPRLLWSLQRANRSLAEERDRLWAEREELASQQSTRDSELTELRALAAEHASLVRSSTWRAGRALAFPLRLARTVARGRARRA